MFHIVCFFVIFLILKYDIRFFYFILFCSPNFFYFYVPKLHNNSIVFSMLNKYLALNVRNLYEAFFLEK